MNDDDYSPEDHALAKKWFEERGAKVIMVGQGLSGGPGSTVKRSDGYRAYLPEARRHNQRMNRK